MNLKLVINALRAVLNDFYAVLHKINSHEKTRFPSLAGRFYLFLGER